MSGEERVGLAEALEDLVNRTVRADGLTNRADVWGLIARWALHQHADAVHAPEAPAEPSGERPTISDDLAERRRAVEDENGYVQTDATHRVGARYVTEKEWEGLGLGAPPTPSPEGGEGTDRRCEYLPGTIGAELHCLHWHNAEDDTTPCCWCGSVDDDSGSCPGPASPPPASEGDQT